MTEPKLLTERELLGLLEWNTKEDILDELRKRGLVAPEPVDPDLLEAREIVAQTYNWTQRCFDDGHPAVVSTLAAIKRGRQLEQPKPLTREMVVKAHQKALGDFGSLSIHRLHAALMEQMK